MAALLSSWVSIFGGVGSGQKYSLKPSQDWNKNLKYHKINAGPIRSLTKMENPFGSFYNLSVKPLIVIYRRGNFVYHHWESWLNNFRDFYCILIGSFNNLSVQTFEPLRSLISTSFRLHQENDIFIWIYIFFFFFFIFYLSNNRISSN